jgi:hypothetical protein
MNMTGWIMLAIFPVGIMIYFLIDTIKEGRGLEVLAFFLLVGIVYGWVRLALYLLGVK